MLRALPGMEKTFEAEVDANIKPMLYRIGPDEPDAAPFPTHPPPPSSCVVCLSPVLDLGCEINRSPNLQ